jgi:hypothetical protein
MLPRRIYNAKALVYRHERRLGHGHLRAMFTAWRISRGVAVLSPRERARWFQVARIFDALESAETQDGGT